MQYSTQKEVKTRKPHQCESCKTNIPSGTKCLWYKAVSFRDSETGHQWHEGWICPKCVEEGQKDGEANG